MTYPPPSRVIVAPLTPGPIRKALVVSKVNDSGAYVVRMADGRRITVSESQLRPNNQKR